MPVVVGSRLDRRATVVGIAAFVVPVVAWIASLGLSYVVQDFACSAAASAGRPLPSGGIVAIVTALNGLLLALTLAAVVAGFLLLRRARKGHADAVPAFLGLAGAILGLLVAFSIVLIAAVPFVFGGCG